MKINNNKLTYSAKLMLISILITNIGNGIHLITVGKILYDTTGSPIYFGLTIIFEYIIGSLTQLFSGSIVDRGNPKNICVISDLLRGVYIITASLFISSDNITILIFVSILLINFAKPFYKSATFSIGSHLSKKEALLKYNSMRVSFSQAGQIIGVMLIGPVLQNLGTSVAFAIDGFSYLLSGIIIFFVNIGLFKKKLHANHSIKTLIIDDWKEVLSEIKMNKTLMLLIILSSGDIIAVNLFNIMQVPLVTLRFSNNLYWLSAFDGGFAIGSLIFSIFVIKLIQKYDVSKLLSIGIGIFGLMYILISLITNPFYIIVVTFIMGAAVTLSNCIFSSQLQENSNGNIKGRIITLRNMIISILSCIIIPITGFFYENSLFYGIIFSAIICFVYFLLIIFALKRNLIILDKIQNDTT